MKGTEPHEAFWQRQLSEPPPLPTLPWDKENPPISSFLRETISSALAPEAWLSIKELAASLGATSQAVLIAALKALLFRHTGQTDLVIGTFLKQQNGAPETELVALRTQITGEATARALILETAASIREASAHLDVPFSAVAEMLGRVPDAKHEGLFNTALIWAERANSQLGAAAFESAYAEHLMACAFLLRVTEVEERLELVCDYDAELFEAASMERLMGHLRNLLSEIAAAPDTPLERLNLLDPAERRQLLLDWNATGTDLPNATCIHQLVEAQVKQSPTAIAVVCRGEELTYAQLNARANQLAAYLSKLGVGPEALVGICAERSLEMLIGLLGVLKAGGAYLPLDPAYPPERVAFMLEDAGVRVLLTQGHLASALPAGKAQLVRLDLDWTLIDTESADTVERGLSSSRLAYVIYTSGSTGKPKGVMVEHGNVLNFFAGMDARIPHPPGSTWLAVTSPSFDISVLELFWTLARGFKVVLYAGDERPGPTHAPSRRMDFSLFYFSSNQDDGPGGAYRLLIEGAKFADEHGFAAVWTPERHFHEFGGLYPNPSVTSAALAMVTKRVQIRSGSVVAPLHSPLRIAEEWSVVDNLSNGRAAISFASGWMPEDFAVSPGSYAKRKELMLQHLETVKKLWCGEGVQVPGPLGKDVTVKIFPRPVQSELPLWLTAAGNPDTFQIAGTLGTSVLTHLLGQSIEEVARKVAIYRQAWKEAGHSGRGHVSLMLHTFVGDCPEVVKEAVRGPLIEYLRKSADLIKGYAWAFSAFKHQSKSKEDIDFSALSKEEMDAILSHAFDRYFETSGLFGTATSCLATIDKLQANDIDEVACLIDFGINPDVVLDNLKHLNDLREAVTVRYEQAAPDYSIQALIERHQVTHFQCTPSMAGMLLLDESARSAFERLRTLMIGGEAFPVTLAHQLRKLVPGDIINMYGPTETTVWSSTYQLPSEPFRVPVGRPIANTEIYILDQNLQPVPVGIAGELMIGGAGVARGYLNRPELTAERFIPNQFQRNGGRRLYRTGDLARYLPDGNIELLGRMDHQVKIRGHRVELGEIEALLNSHPNVRESVVIAREAASGDKKLVAYIVLREGQDASGQLLRRFAKERMPEYMVPTQVVLMSAFPQTPNKKIDRKALPAPEVDTSEKESQFETPATVVEKAVADVWSELLGVERIGRTDNFFDLGGNSLSATQVVSRLREFFGVSLSLASVFDAPTIVGMAALLVANEARPGLVEKAAKVLSEIELMTDDALDEELGGQERSEGTP